MTLWVALRNLRARWAGTLLTVLAVALAGTLALVVPMLLDQLERGAADSAQVFDLLITAPGSDVQAVTSSVFLMEPPLGNVPYGVYEDLRSDERTLRVVPIGLGDGLRSHPVVGTNEQFFEMRLSGEDDPFYRLAEGELFRGPFEAVIGAAAARELALTVGDRFTTAHGFRGEGGQIIPAGDEPADEHEHEGAVGLSHDHADEYLVTGILAPTGSAFDRAIITDMESVWLSHGQAAAASREITALFYTARQLNHFYAVAAEVDELDTAQAVFIGQVFGQLRSVMLQGQEMYRLISLLVLVLSALTVALYVHSSATARRRQVSLLRVLGAGRGSVFSLVILETGIASLAGVTLATGLSLAVAAGLSGVLAGMLGFSLPAPQLEASWLLAVLALVPLSLLVAFVPALQAAVSSPLENL